MKRILFLLIMLSCVLFPDTLKSQRACFNYRGDWSQWSACTGKVFTNPQYSSITLKTSGGLAYFSFWISSYYKEPTKEERKRHEKNDIWYEYPGWVEYYVNDNYPTASDVSKAACFVIPNPRYDVTPTIARKTTCTIKIAPYKKHPEVYNVIFDDIAVGVSIKGLNFNFK